MSKHLIVTCRRCEQSWDLDYDPDGCICGESADEALDDITLDLVDVEDE